MSDVRLSAVSRIRLGSIHASLHERETSACAPPSRRSRSSSTRGPTEAAWLLSSDITCLSLTCPQVVEAECSFRSCRCPGGRDHPTAFSARSTPRHHGTPGEGGGQLAKLAACGQNGSAHEHDRHNTQRNPESTSHRLTSVGLLPDQLRATSYRLPTSYVVGFFVIAYTSSSTNG